MSAQNAGLSLRLSATELSSPAGASVSAGGPTTVLRTSGALTKMSSREPATSDQVSAPASVSILDNIWLAQV